MKKVPGIGEATFVQAAGFLKISGGDNPLDATWIHPESYELAHRVMEKLGITAEDLTKADKRAELAARINQVNVEALAAELNCGVFTLRDILAQFVRPGRDPREELPPPVFKQGILKLEDLSPGMELMGTVLNVVDFGAFVDIGLPNSGLVHRSRMDRNFVADPHSVVAVGDVVRVWVVDVDR
ncbi:MAG: S1 RNA-binding domain-containing protein, partial [Thermogutta sp.]